MKWEKANIYVNAGDIIKSKDGILLRNPINKDEFLVHHELKYIGNGYWETIDGGEKVNVSSSISTSEGKDFPNTEQGLKDAIISLNDKKERK